MKKFFLIVLLGLSLIGCSSKFKTYNGPRVTEIQVYKAQRRMYLLHNDEILKTYRIHLGFAPLGHKQVEGDGKTPEGSYVIDRKNPNSEFHLSVGISYPNQIDAQRAEALGASPGGDIFIHGRPQKYRGSGADWTAGCIAVTDRQVEEIYAMVEVGTPIHIFK